MTDIEVFTGEIVEPITVHVAEILAALWMLAHFAEIASFTDDWSDTRHDLVAATFYDEADKFQRAAVGSGDMERANELVWRVLDMPRHTYATERGDWR